jgi:hypothetical protein
LPSSLASNAHAEALWQLASPLPARMRLNLQRALRGEAPLGEGARGYMFHLTSPAHLRALFRGGTPRNRQSRS